MRYFLVLSMTAVLANGQSYFAERALADSLEIVRLGDRSRQIEVLIAPSLGNNAYRMAVKGINIFWAPYAGPGELKARPAQGGNPLLAPWANRLDQDAFYANGKKYLLNPELGNWRRDQNGKPIHGLLVYSSAWELVEVKADASGAETTSRLEFYRYPDLIAQFPFAHTLWMTHRLSEGRLEVRTRIENHAREAMPVGVGYHTYYRLEDAPRDDWKVHVAAREQVVLSAQLLPTGERRPVSLPDPVRLGDTQLDDVFTGLVRDGSGRAEFWVQGKSQKIAVEFGPRYRVAVIYAPKGRNFICFEPMAGVTNAFNLAHAGLYPELERIPPGGHWQESFWIRPEGF
jgi:aldose 1-epimerase